MSKQPSSKTCQFSICTSHMCRKEGAKPSSDDMQAALAKAQREAGPIIVPPAPKRGVAKPKGKARARWQNRLFEHLTKERKDV